MPIAHLDDILLLISGLEWFMNIWQRREVQWMLTLKTRWMPEGEEELSWPWIKEALPPIQLTKVYLPFLAFWDPLPFGTLFWLFLMALCRTSLSSQWSWPPTPSAILLLWTSLKTTYQRCHNIGQMIFFNIGRSRQYHICHLYRFMKGYRMTWQPSRLWWREEEGNTTTLTQKMLLAALIFEHL